MKHFLLICLVFTAFLFACSCNKVAKKDLPAKPVVIATVAPYANFAETLLQDIALVETLVPANANLHLYEPAPRQIDKIKNSTVWIRLGESFEQKAVNFILEKACGPVILDLSQHTNLLFSCSCTHHNHDTSSADLHYWLSTKEATRHVLVMQELFCTLWPQEQEIISERAERLLEKLTKLDQQISALLADKQGTTLMVAHAAFGYFCRDYHLHQVSLEHEGKDPRPQNLLQVLETAQQVKPPFILTQFQHNKKPAEWVAKELDLPLKEVDPYARNYFDNMLEIAQTIGN